jgi:hypothetical protein
MATKYSNGMYKSTTKIQDKVSITIFKSMKFLDPTTTMSTQLLQTTGHCLYTISQVKAGTLGNERFEQGVLVFELDRRGSFSQF